MTKSVYSYSNGLRKNGRPLFRPILVELNKKEGYITAHGSDTKTLGGQDFNFGLNVEHISTRELLYSFEQLYPYYGFLDAEVVSEKDGIVILEMDRDMISDAVQMK